MSIIKLLEGEERAQALSVDGFTIPVPPETLVLGAVEDGRVVGRIMLLQMLHLEGTWVAEDKRGSTLAPRLVKAAEELLVRCGSTHAIAYTPESNPQIGQYLERFGYSRFPVTTWQKSLKE